MMRGAVRDNNKNWASTAAKKMSKLEKLLADLVEKFAGVIICGLTRKLSAISPAEPKLITECDDKISFFRFTPEQAEMYRKYRCEDYCLMTNSTADVRAGVPGRISERVGFDYELSFEFAP